MKQGSRSPAMGTVKIRDAMCCSSRRYCILPCTAKHYQLACAIRRVAACTSSFTGFGRGFLPFFARCTCLFCGRTLQEGLEAQQLAGSCHMWSSCFYSFLDRLPGDIVDWRRLRCAIDINIVSCSSAHPSDSMCHENLNPNLRTKVVRP